MHSTNNVICSRCKQLKPNNQTSKCGFMTGHFDANNYHCCTVNEIRRIADRLSHPAIHGVSFTACANEQRYSVIDVSNIAELQYEDQDSPISLYVGWYKSRGRTECMWLMFEIGPQRPPTELECNAIINAYQTLL